MRNTNLFNLYYRLFFIGYFLAIDFGEKRNPRESGIYFVTILSLGICLSTIFTLISFGIDINANYAIPITSGIVVIMNYRLLNLPTINKLLPEFEYIGEEIYKPRRRMIGIVCFGLFLVITLGSALINNEGIKNGLTMFN